MLSKGLKELWFGCLGSSHFMWTFEEIKNYAAAMAPEPSKRTSKTLGCEGEAREVVAGKAAVRSREGLVVIF